MAIVTAIKTKTQSKTAMAKVMAYVAQEHKTRFSDPETGQSYQLISGQNCVAETAYQEFMSTKLLHGKDNGVFYKHYVQSFKPDVNISPKEIHKIAVELAEYFEGFEVLIATHIDVDHWHSHLIVNSVNAETGLKIQFNERNLNELRKRSDEICQTHGLEILKPYKKQSPVAGINTREYRAAVKGDSWKFKLMNEIDNAMSASMTKADFIANMERMGYGVKWIEHHKYITYTTPDGQKCRDNRLHDEKYLKERLEAEYEFRSVERTKSEQHRADFEAVSAVGLRDSERPMGSDFENAVGQSHFEPGNSHDGEYDTDSGRIVGQRKQDFERDSDIDSKHDKPLEQCDFEPVITGWENTRNGNGIGGESNGEYFQPVETNQILSCESGGNNGKLADIASGIAWLVGSLSEIIEPIEEEQKQEDNQVIERKNRQKEKQNKTHDRSWEMSL